MMFEPGARAFRCEMIIFSAAVSASVTGDESGFEDNVESKRRISA
jgi:hypothetical protein